MELDIELRAQGVELHHPGQALQAWTNGVRTIEGSELPEEEKILKGDSNNNEFQAIVVEQLISEKWSARAVRNVIEERYPALSTDKLQLETRRLLMKILGGAMDDVEAHRKETRVPHKGSVIL